MYVTFKTLWKGLFVFFNLRYLISCSFWYILEASTSTVKVSKLTVLQWKQANKQVSVKKYRNPKDGITGPCVLSKSSLLYLSLSAGHGRPWKIKVWSRTKVRFFNHRAIDFQILPRLTRAWKCKDYFIVFRFLKLSLSCQKQFTQGSNKTSKGKVASFFD